MRIGLISFEYPPDTAVGGIATYMQQWAYVLSFRGHEVEVFCSNPREEGFKLDGNIRVNFCKTEDRSAFKRLIVPTFSSRHRYKKFDLIESPEFGNDGKFIKEQFPELLLVVKLHTPSFLSDELNNSRKKYKLTEKIRVILGAYRRLKKPIKYWDTFKKIDKAEADFIKTANIITSPSYSLIDIVAKRFKIPITNIHHLPNPYKPSKELLSIKQNPNSKIITYLGRIEKRKGVFIFSKVVPAIVEKFPGYKFHFIGKDTFSFPEGVSSKQILLNSFGKYRDSVHFIDNVTLEEIPSKLKESCMCIFPSLWENFPTVCLEAMSAGLPVIGSKNGGMKDMLEAPKAGILVDPENAEDIINAIELLITSEHLRLELGSAARTAVIDKYNGEIIGERFEKLISKVTK